MTNEQADSLSEDSETGTDQSHKFGVPRSRQALVKPFVQGIVNFVLTHDTILEQEYLDCNREMYVPLANHYVEKVIRRIGLILGG